MLPDGMLPGIPGVRPSYTINDDGLDNYGLLSELLQDMSVHQALSSSIDLQGLAENKTSLYGRRIGSDSDLV